MDKKIQAQLKTHAAHMDNGVKTYGKGDTRVKALDDVTVQFEQGKFTTIMGPSGSGKSTLLHCAAGLDNLTRGKVYIGDTELGSINDRKLTDLRRQKVGFIFQAFNLVPTLTAKENILLPLSIAGEKPDEKWFNRVVNTLKLKSRLNHIPSELSGGQQQRVAAARALVSKPAIIFADEPTGNLDSKSSRQMLRFMKAVVKVYSQTIVMVTHDPIAASFSDRVIFLDDGKMVDQMYQPNPRKIFDKLKSLGD